MKCPLTYSPRYFWHEVTRHEAADCLKEECAWWRKDWKCCQVTASPMLLGMIADHLDVISEKMPSDLLEELRLLVGACGMIADNMPPARE